MTKPFFSFVWILRFTFFYFVFGILSIFLGHTVFALLGANQDNDSHLKPIYMFFGSLLLPISLPLIKIPFITIAEPIANSLRMKRTLQDMWAEFGNTLFLFTVGTFFGLFYRVIGYQVFTGTFSGKASDLFTPITEVFSLLGFFLSTSILKALKYHKHINVDSSDVVAFFLTNWILIAIFALLSSLVQMVIH